MTNTTGRAPAARTGTPTPAELIRRAVALRDRLRAQQDQAEAAGRYGPDIHEELVRAGFYHLLTPRRYGGLEVDLPTFFKVVIEISRGDPSSGWCFCLGHGHNLTTAAHWPAEGQDELFRTQAGYFRASHSVVGAGTARPVTGGYVVNARSPYQSGVPYSTHATVNVRLEGATTDPPPVLAAIVPCDQLVVLDDWGGEATLGERASGSNTVVVTDVFVPSTHVVPFDWVFHDYTGPSVGTQLHGNPMYLGPVAAYFHSELVSTIVGAAHAAVDEYERIITSRTSLMPPFAPRSEDPFHLADLGMAITMADASEALLLRAAAQYTEYCEETVSKGKPFTVEMDNRLYGVVQRAGQMASDAVELLYRSAGSAAGKGGQPMQRYFRDVSMYRGHVSAQYEWTARRIADIHLGRRTTPFGPAR